MPSSEPDRLGGEELGARLDAIFSFDVSSGRSYQELIDALAPQPRDEQEFALHWAQVAARTHLEIAYLAVLLAPQALRRLSRRQAEAWLVAALEGFDRSGLRTAVVRLRDIEGFARGARGEVLALQDVDARLGRFLQGLSGRNLRIAAAEAAWTDTETVFLPPAIAAAGREAGTERYKAMAALLWAQARYGTFNVDLDAALPDGPGRDAALAWLALLEALRLGARLGRELPGMREELVAMLHDLPPQLDSARAVLAASQAGVADSLEWLRQRPQLLADLPQGCGWLGALRPDEARRLRDARIRQQAEVLRLSVAELLESLREEKAASQLDLEADAERLEVKVMVDGQELTLPPEGLAAAQSLIQDLGEIPPELLVAAGEAPWKPADRPAGGAGATMETRADLLLDEWDYRRQAYRRGWCHVYLHTVGGDDLAYVPAVRARHAPLVRQLRRRFEAMRGEDRILRRQADGPEVDMDALVEAIADRRGGAEPGPRLFCRRQRDERSLAAAFLVDMSGSTEGWINDAEREALVMLCEALEMLDDRYAIWGFLGLDADALRPLPHQGIRRSLRRRGALAHRRDQAARLHAHGPADPLPDAAPARRTGEASPAGQPVRRPAGRFRRRLPQPVRHRGHPPGAARSAPGRRALLLRDARPQRPRLPQAHVRPGGLLRARRRAQAAAEDRRHLSQADHLTQRAAHRAKSCRRSGPEVGADEALPSRAVAQSRLSSRRRPQNRRRPMAGLLGGAAHGGIRPGRTNQKLPTRFRFSAIAECRQFEVDARIAPLADLACPGKQTLRNVQA
ncbi:MAG: hypothetical protein IPL72_05980 [Sulfuritalea sp.]|nr:hypothetical protein [Sulfuritalea sp.]